MTQTEREYAEAMFALSLESGEKDTYLDALITVRGVMRENPEYIELLASPAIPFGEKCECIDKAFSGMPEHVISFLKILCENGRVQSVCECIDEYEKLMLTASGTVSADIVSAAELSDAQKEKLINKLEKLTGKKVVASYTTDTSLIGGVRVSLDGVTYDGSVKGRLDEVKEVIIG